uniref:Uncharacterized protein n=1 Tax=Tanacetum cinerariifolium TaxID=118510 RepID=A0A6L2LG35_TANCI|nr:hypothetical protein [Tanacetum cinerariifolium]
MFMHAAQDDSILGPMRFVSKSKDFQKMKTLVTIEEEEPEPAKKVIPFKKPFAKRQSIGVRIRDTPGGSSEGVDSELEVPDEPKGKSIDTSEGTGLKLGVLDMSKGDSSEREYKSWGDSDDEANVQNDEDVQDSDDKPQHDDHKRTDSENQETNDDEEETKDEFVHTPINYVPTNEEKNDESNDVTKEEYERINEELYNDVNISLTYAEIADKEKDDEEINIVGHVNTNQEGAGNQVDDDAQKTQKTKVYLPSSSISSDYAAKFINFDNIPSADTKVVSMLEINVQHEVPHTSSLFTILMSVILKQDVINQFEIVTTTPAPTISSLISSLYPSLQQIDVKELKHVDNSLKVISVIKSEVPNVVKEYLGSNLDDALDKVIQINFADIIKEHSVPTEIDEDAMDEGVADKLKKRKPDDADKDKGPSTGSDQGLKRHKTSKDTKASKKSKSTESSKGTSKSQPKSTGKSAQADETVFKARDTQGPQNLQKDTGNTNEPLIVNVDPKDCDLAKAKKPSRTFDDLMSTLIDFSALIINRLQISELTQYILVGPGYNILKGTCRSYVEHDYSMKECFKALTDQLDWNNPEGNKYPFDLSKPLPLVMLGNHQIVLVDYFFNNDLPYLQGGSTGRTYTTSLTKTKAVKYDLPEIENMVPNLWSPVKVAYDKHALLGTSYWGPKR